MSVVDRSFDHPLKVEERASMPLAGGINQLGYQCGMLWGAALAGGAQAYRLYDPGPQAETAAIVAAQRLVESFRARNKHIDCSEIAEMEWKTSSKLLRLKQTFKFFLRGGPIMCTRMTARYAKVAFSEINSALSEVHIEAPAPPVSCTALLAGKMGVSDMRTVMAAGLAGGIGFSGSGCGALGAALWINGMKLIEEGLEEGAGDNLWKSKVFRAKAEDTIDRFIKSKAADFRFECSEIVGRKFESVGDHAGYLRDGGCSELIELLAAESYAG